MLEHLIQQYGYIALFIGTMLEGEVVLIIAGYAAFQGYMSLPIVIVLAFLGSLVSDHTFFSIGRKKGRDFLEGRPRLRKKNTKSIYIAGKSSLVASSRVAVFLRF